MCGPLAVPVAMMAAGAAANYAGKRRSDRAMTAARAAESVRQQGLQAENDRAWVDTLSRQGAEPAKDEMAASADRRVQSEQALAGPRIELPMVAATGNRTIADEVSRQDAAQGARTAQMGAARRTLDSLGDSLLLQGLARARGGEQIGTVNSMRRGSVSVLPYELQYASQRGAGLQTIGTILTQMGASGLMGAAMTGAGTAATGASAGGGLTVPADAGTYMGQPAVIQQPGLSVAQPYGLGLRVPIIR